MRKISSSEITPEAVYLNRRQFMQAAGVLSLSAAALAACGGNLPETQPAAGGAAEPAPAAQSAADELGDPLTSFEAVTTYNNYYEFSTDKGAVAKLAKDLVVSPWQVAVGGLVNKPQVFDLDDLKQFGEEERVYRLRCDQAGTM